MEVLPKFAGRQKLSPREVEVVNYLIQGFTNKEVARELHISHRTVEDHRMSIFRKLEVKNIVDVVRRVYAQK